MEDGLYGFFARYHRSDSDRALKTPPRTHLDLLRPCIQNRYWTPPTLHPSATSPEYPELPYCKQDAVAESDLRMQVPTLAAGLVSASSEPSVKVVPLRRSTRFVKPPDRLDL